MTNMQEDRHEELSRLLELWEARSTIAPDWRGIGDCSTSQPFICFMEHDSDFSNLQREASRRGIKVQPRFVYDDPKPAEDKVEDKVGTGLQALQPGLEIHATKNGLMGCKGTLGAFLSFSDPPLIGDQIWLLSCDHVVGNMSGAGSPQYIRDQQGNIISTRPIPRSLFGDGIDVASVTLDHPEDANPDFTGLNLTSSQPTPVNQGDTVGKIGSKTGLTFGDVFCIARTITLPHCFTTGGTVEFTESLLISSRKGKPFVDKEDSGSLVVGNGGPAALIFGKLNLNDSKDPSKPDPVSPLCIAVTFDQILPSLQKMIPDPSGRGRNLEIILQAPMRVSHRGDL